jgi:hypothetical protein
VRDGAVRNLIVVDPAIARSVKKLTDLIRRSA